MKQLLMQATSGDLRHQVLRHALRNSAAGEMELRRGIAALSLLGMGCMAVVSLYQLGMIRHLPDPPTRWPHCHSDKVNASSEAYSYGMPDGPLTLALHAVNLGLAAAGPPDRARHRPWLPLLASLVSGAQAAVAAKYLFYRMPKVDRAWCPYCVTDARTHFATFAMTLPESLRAIIRR
ncbi:MAG: vitamin K epoxide reductase family protein [Acetobacteraceae bacterium]|nr:vitamin K epoxide reductase family protein [Acetobacteraceae bacterium]